MKKNIAIVMVVIMCAGAFTACSSKNVKDREVIDKEGKQITVIGNKNPEVYNGVALEKIDKLKDVRALDWIDENTLLVMKENKDYPEVQRDSKKSYPQNFYEYDINTQKFKLIAGSNTDMAYGIMSPDKKYIFYKEGIEVNLTGFILNKETGEKVKVTNIDSIASTEGAWIDNNTVIFSEFPQGGIYTADTKGNVKPVKNSISGMISNSTKIEDKIFYTTVDGKLYVQTVDSKENKLIKNDVIWLIPSPDLQSFMMVKRTDKTKMALVLTDIEGNEKKVLAEGTQIFGTNWSPDKSKIAYSIASEKSGQSGIFVADANSGKVVQLTVDNELVSDAVRWSPSGKKLLSANLVRENNENHFITSIIQLK